MSKAERPTQQLRNHSANCAQALSRSQLRSPGDNDRKGPSHRWPPPWEATAPDCNVVPPQQWQGHRAQLLRHLLSTQVSKTSSKPGPPGPFPSRGNSPATARSCTAYRAFPPSQERPKYIKLSSLPAPPSLGSGVPARATVPGNSPR